MINVSNTIQPVRGGGPTVKTLNGSVLLNGTQLTVNVSYCTNGSSSSKENIKLGNEVFKINGVSNDGDKVTLEGLRRDPSCGVDKNVTVIINDDEFLQAIRKNPKGVAEEMRVDNKEEFNCLPNDNALILLSDNKSMSMVGNCTRLQ